MMALILLIRILSILSRSSKVHAVADLSIWQNIYHTEKVHCTRFYPNQRQLQLYQLCYIWDNASHLLDSLGNACTKGHSVALSALLGPNIVSEFLLSYDRKKLEQSTCFQRSMQQSCLGTWVLHRRRGFLKALDRRNWVQLSTSTLPITILTS